MKSPAKSNSGRAGVAHQRLVRRVYSLPITDSVMEDFIEFRARQHAGGRAGYLRDLVARDFTEYRDAETLRQRALSKLTEAERRALGYPLPEVVPDGQGGMCLVVDGGTADSSTNDEVSHGAKNL